MRFRKLRIAWSLSCGMACVLLIALWVRSYYHNDATSSVQMDGWATLIESNFGELSICRYPSQGPPKNWYWCGNTQTMSRSEWVRSRYSPPLDTPRPRFMWYTGPKLFRTQIPHACAVIACLSFAVVPWIRIRSSFSLRTLLFATTLVAIVLAVVVVAIREPTR